MPFGGFNPRRSRGGFPPRGKRGYQPQHFQARPSYETKRSAEDVPDPNPKRFKMEQSPNINFEPRVDAILAGIPIHPIFTVFTSNKGLNRLCQIFHERVVAVDHRVSEALPLWQLQYSSQMAFIYRVLYVNHAASVYTNPNLSLLKAAVEKLEFPGVIADYIETLGVVKLSTGAKILPYFENAEKIFKIKGAVNKERLLKGEIRWSEDYVDPRSILMNEERIILNQPWSIDSEALRLYANGYGRIEYKKQTSSRPIDNSNIEGKPAMMVTASTFEEEEGMTSGWSPQNMLESEFQLGAMYCFRIRNSIAVAPCWDAQLLHTTFEGARFNMKMSLSHLVRVPDSN